MRRDLLDRYLRILGVPQREPGREALAELVRAHVERVPFENVSKLYRYRRSGLAGVPGLEEYLDGIERLRLGGTCYANNFHLNELFVALGYDARLCGADMSRPDVHAVNVVVLGGRDFLVDAGYGAPFLAPMPLDLGHDQVVALGGDRYVLRPRDAERRSAVELHRDGRLRHGYRVRAVPRDPGHFREAIADSFLPDATFMNAIVLVRFRAGGAVALRNLSVVEAHGTTERRRTLANRADLARIVQSVFGVPRDVTDEALSALRDLSTDPWG